MAINFDDLYDFILEMSGLDSVNNSYSDLTSGDAEKIYECIDGKTDKILDFVLENCVDDSDMKLTAKDIRAMKAEIQSESTEEVLLNLAEHLDSEYLDGEFEDTISKVKLLVDLDETFKQISEFKDEIYSEDAFERSRALTGLCHMFLDFGAELAVSFHHLPSNLLVIYLKSAVTY